jgi:hypothetical protein
LKRRLLKFLLIATLVLAFTSYFAFSTFVFSPTESDFTGRVSTLIPRDVDFYIAKTNLSEAFDEFPKLAFLDELDATAAGQTYFASPEWQVLRADLEVEKILTDMENTLSALPIELDPLEVLGGRSLAVAGYFRGKEVMDAEWAVYARGNWMAKLAVAGMKYPALLDLEAQGISVIVDGELISISGGALPRPLHLTRLHDVIVLSTSLEMLQSVETLVTRQGEDSFGGSARYFDHIQQRSREGDEAEVYIDYRAFSEAQQFTGRWPDVKSEDFGPAFMGRLFQSGALKELIGIAGFDEGISLEFHGELSSELVTPFQKQVYRQRGFDRDKIYDAAKMVPADVGLFGLLRTPLGITLRQALLASERALQDNLNDVVREVWNHPDAQPLIDDLDRAFHDRVAVMMRTNDYPEDVDGPPHNDTPVFAWAVVLWVDDASKINEIRRRVIDNQVYFGIQGREPGASGVLTNEVDGGHSIHEYWSSFIPGTGHIASVMDQDHFIVSNSFQMLEQILKTFYEGGTKYPRLSESPQFASLVQSSLTHANLAVWARPDGLSGSLREMAERAAENEVVIDWRVMRGQIDRRVLNEHFPDWNIDSLSIEQAAELEELASVERDNYERDLKAAQVPVLKASYDRQITYLQAMTGVLLEIALDPKKLDVSAQVILPLED